MREHFSINGTTIKPGTRSLIDLELPRLNSHTRLSMPVHVVHGRREGPCMFVSAAIHGDEVNGVEIVRRLLEHKGLKHLKGTLVAVPVVNVYGLIHESRYLPDRRDLNRVFPGSDKGSLAGRVANLFMSEIVSRCSYGIDLHTGAIHRNNLPQIRANLDDPETAHLARVFGVPLLLNSSLRDGSLREAAAEHGIPMLLYEAGEGLRYDETAIRAGLSGIINVMNELGMISTRSRQRAQVEPFEAHSSIWVRAPESGMLSSHTKLGALTEKKTLLGYIHDPYSGEATPVTSPTRGVIIGRTQIPMVHEGEALFHIARFTDDMDEVMEQVESFHLVHADEIYD